MFGQADVDAAAVRAIAGGHHQVVDVGQDFIVIRRRCCTCCGQADGTCAGIDFKPVVAVATRDAVGHGAAVNVRRLNCAKYRCVTAVFIIVKAI